MTDSEMSDIAIFYRDINDVIKQLYKKLYRKLRKNEVSLSDNYNESFTNLINEMKNIPAIERYYDTNIEPDNDVILPQLSDTPTISLREYNLLLAQKFNFYMRLMGYYLALKGVPLQSINNALTLNERIDLIDQIDKLFLVIFIVNMPERGYYDEYINIKYEIVSLKNEIVTDGIIEVYYGDIIVKRINVGESLKFKPLELERNYYDFVFSRSNKYKSTRVTKSIFIRDRNTIEQVFLLTDTNNIDADGLNIEYITGNINTPQKVLVDMYIDNNELCLEYEEYNNVNFLELDKGVIDIDIVLDEEWNPCIQYLTIQEDNVENLSP